MRRSRMRMMILVLCTLAYFSAGSSQEFSIHVTNPAPFVRPLETIEVPWNEIRAKLSLSSQQNVEVLETGKQLVSQKIDYDGDGAPDQLLFQSSFKANEQKEFVVRVTGTKQEV